MKFILTKQLKKRGKIYAHRIMSYLHSAAWHVSNVIEKQNSTVLFIPALLKKYCVKTARKLSCFHKHIYDENRKATDEDHEMSLLAVIIFTSYNYVVKITVMLQVISISSRRYEDMLNLLRS